MMLLAVIIGASLILFVIRFIWMPPDTMGMGMMMGRGQLSHHFSMWMMGTVLLAFFAAIILLLIWFIKEFFKK